jgi:hypothetical protein
MPCFGIYTLVLILQCIITMWNTHKIDVHCWVNIEILWCRLCHIYLYDCLYVEQCFSGFTPKYFGGFNLVPNGYCIFHSIFFIVPHIKHKWLFCNKSLQKILHNSIILYDPRCNGCLLENLKIKSMGLKVGEGGGVGEGVWKMCQEIPTFKISMWCLLWHMLY